MMLISAGFADELHPGGGENQVEGENGEGASIHDHCRDKKLLQVWIQETQKAKQHRQTPDHDQALSPAAGGALRQRDFTGNDSKGIFDLACQLDALKNQNRSGYEQKNVSQHRKAPND